MKFNLFSKRPEAPGTAHDLLNALSHKQTKKALSLIDAGADLTVTDNGGRNALMWAIVTRNDALILKLLEKKIDTAHKDNAGLDAVTYGAIAGLSFETMTAIITATASHETFKSAVQAATHNKNWEAAMALTEAGANIDFLRAENPNAFLHIAHGLKDRRARAPKNNPSP